MGWLHHYTRLLTACSLLLITAGGLVTSTGSGLAVPDWPSTYGYFMFSFPLSNMVGGILYEHGHRLIASVVGMMTIGLAVWISWTDRRAWVRRLGWIALAAVVTQGLLGGITVLYFLPAPVSIGHAGLAQLFFALVVSLAVFTSPGWLREYDRDDGSRQAVADDAWLRGLALAAPAAIYLQILVGATMRHTGAGLAIPDVPLAFGRLIPPAWNAAIAVHFAHRVGAVVVASVLVALAATVLRRHHDRPELTRPVRLSLGVVAAQIVLGGWTVLSERQVAINTAHVAMGAVLLATAVVICLRIHRGRFAHRSSVTTLVEERTTGVGPTAPVASRAKSLAHIETPEAPGWPGAPGKTARQQSTEEQRLETGRTAGRLPSDVHDGLLASPASRGASS